MRRLQNGWRVYTGNAPSSNSTTFGSDARARFSGERNYSWIAGYLECRRQKHAHPPCASGRGACQPARVIDRANIVLCEDLFNGAAGVAIDSVPPEGVRRVPLAQTRAAFPVLRNSANRHRAVGFTPEQFHYAFANTLSEEDSEKVYERYHIPAPGRFIWAAVLANFEPGHQDGYVNYKNDDRAALLR